MGEQGLREFTQMSEFHGDGWGVAWYDRQQPGRVHLQKSPLRAADSTAYAGLVHRKLGDLGVVHLRWATPGLPVEPRNTHPFRRGSAVMAHNGAIHPQDRLGEMLPPAWERQLTGTTDSERYFLHVMSGVEAGEDMISAIEATVAHIDRMFSPNSLNAVLLTPDALYAICYYWPERIPHAALAARGLECGTDQYFELAHLETDAGIVVASSGWPQPGWTPLPNRNVLVVDRATLQVKVSPLNPPAPAGQTGPPSPLPALVRGHAGPPGPSAAWTRSRARPPAGTRERHRVDAESRCSATLARCCSIARMPRRPCRCERDSAPTIASASRMATPAANATASSASFRSCMSIM
jgi:predicted glutamine amidotransferase